MIFIWAAEWRNERSKPSSSSTKPINKLNLFHEINLVFDGVLRCPFAKSIFNFIQHFISFKEKWKSWWNKIDWRLSWRASPRCFGCSIQSKTFTFWFHCSTKSNYFYNINLMKFIKLTSLFFSLYWNQNQSTHKPKKWVGLCWLIWLISLLYWICGLWAGGSSSAAPFHSANLSICFISTALPLACCWRKEKWLMCCWIRESWLKVEWEERWDWVDDWGPNS